MAIIPIFLQICFTPVRHDQIFKLCFDHVPVGYSDEYNYHLLRKQILETKTYFVCWMKMIKNILFKVISIAIYTFFPPLWKATNATLIKLFVF